MVELKENDLSSKSSSDQIRSIIGATCPAQTSVNHQCNSENPSENDRLDDTSQRLGAHCTDSNGSLKNVLVPFSAPSAYLYDSPTVKRDNSNQERGSTDNCFTDRSIHSTHKVNTHRHRNSSHYGSFNRIQHNACRSPNEDNQCHATDPVLFGGTPERPVHVPISCPTQGNGYDRPVIATQSREQEQHGSRELNQQPPQLSFEEDNIQDDELFGDGIPQNHNNEDVDREQSDTDAEEKPKD